MFEVIVIALLMIITGLLLHRVFQSKKVIVL